MKLNLIRFNQNLAIASNPQQNIKTRVKTKRIASNNPFDYVFSHAKAPKSYPSNVEEKISSIQKWKFKKIK